MAVVKISDHYQLLNIYPPPPKKKSCSIQGISSTVTNKVLSIVFFFCGRNFSEEGIHIYIYVQGILYTYIDIDIGSRGEEGF